MTVIENRNTATDLAALIIPSVGSNHDRHSKLQRFMLANDSTTIAVEVPIWLLEDDIATLEEIYRVSVVPKPIVGRGRHMPRFITGHIDFLQARNGAIHILDYKPERAHQQTDRPAHHLCVALTRLVRGLKSST